jgi:cytochrome P450
VAIHTAKDLLQVTMFNIARHPEVFKAPRKEIVDVLQKNGLTKTALSGLKLMDSVIKESQRLKPSSRILHPPREDRDRHVKEGGYPYT